MIAPRRRGIKKDTQFYGEPLSPPFDTRLFVRQMAALRRIAAARNATVTFVIREAVDDWLRRHDEPTAQP